MIKERQKEIDAMLAEATTAPEGGGGGNGDGGGDVRMEEGEMEIPQEGSVASDVREGRSAGARGEGSNEASDSD